MTVLVYVNTGKQVGDAEHIKVFANQDAAETWFAENDPEGVAFEYEVLEYERGRQLGRPGLLVIQAPPTRSRRRSLAPKRSAGERSKLSLLSLEVAHLFLRRIHPLARFLLFFSLVGLAW
ncbi:hypothetical protein [Bradyrhizobium australiense]|uniref:Uncharacterized protein n=1 Tax=Bradyrhizobium australiense TaxID=2721161 RepID=A0A7Y4GWV7_9BRAD|nr:hypothetical protein [Bradyrhizobium australiense]NOJ43361.1 hypothetical protein [Bradyrhizobium australiense]